MVLELVAQRAEPAVPAKVREAQLVPLQSNGQQAENHKDCDEISKVVKN